jgi:hypothetical protein
MQEIEFQLFRIQVYTDEQGNLFRSESRTDLLREAIESYPQMEFRRGVKWHVGNVEPLGEDALYFRLGKISKATEGRYKNKNFTDEIAEVAPYTHVILDTHLEVLGIARKPELSSAIPGLAHRLQRMLNESKQKLPDVTFVINEIKDPEDFLNYVRDADSILRFWKSISRPNAFDAAELESQFRLLVEDARASTGLVDLKGKELTKSIIEELARSAASVGNKAGATIKSTPDARPERKLLGDNPVIVHESDLDSRERKESILERIRRKYHEIRGAQQ